ncbi:MAG TPA: SAM-dependent methyltransferase [Pseudonocardiaceae bacterium]|jgi:O-methyltransferase involved in polyketide biosynthesis|nr:SAM-dependent methyltransferase [Pseudonocardiaceae bacterium]
MSVADENATPAAEPIPPAKLQELLDASLTKPSEGRVYDYYLGGGSNWAIDRAFAQEQIRQFPDLPWLAKQNRKFLARSVRYLIKQGIRQFVDIGSGLPTEGNVHQVAEAAAPGEVRVVYVDHDPVAHAHGNLLLDRNGDPNRHRTLLADLVDAEELWKAVLGTGVINPDEPIGLLIVSVVHFIPAESRPERAVAYYRSKLAPGSHLVLSHVTDHDMDEESRARLEQVRKNYDKATNPARFRTLDEIRGLFGDWEFAPPGVVWTAEWQDGDDLDEIQGDIDAARSRILAGVARKP